jgi:hypothetical protein
VAGGAAHGNGCMNTFPFRKLFMALQAVVLRVRGKGGKEHKSEKCEQKEFRVHALFLLVINNVLGILVRMIVDMADTITSSQKKFKRRNQK